MHERANRVSPARRAAFDILARIETSDAHSDNLLHGPILAGMSQADRDLTTALVLGVLRWQIALDAQLTKLLARPEEVLALPVVISLRLGAFQLSHLDRVPAHAALNESVELVRAEGHAHAAGMVNAILRKLAGTPKPRRPLVEPPAAIAERLGHPLWLVQRWIRNYGRSAAESICAFDQKEPSCASIFSGATADAPLMDPGSRLVAEIAAEVGRGATSIWDCCAAPGGKTILLANRLQSAELFATDASPVRLNKLRQRLDRHLPNRAIRTRVADASAPQSGIGDFDLILCDVPCSGTGTIARNPEIRHRLQPSDLSRQAQRQELILRRVVEHLQPGGRVVYSTCSLEPEENEQVVRSVLDHSRDLRLRDVGACLRSMAVEGRISLNPEQITKIVQGGALRTLPGSGFEGDGFYAAVLERQT